MSLSESLLAGQVPIAVEGSIQGRFLSPAYYDEKKAGFRKYDPSLWRDTLSLRVSPFMTVPCVALVIFTFALTVVSKLIPAIMAVCSLGPQVHTFLGGALAFIMVFRTNTAYSRWWEARLLWGTVDNTIRSVVARAPAMLKNEAIYQQLITEFVAYAVLLKNLLRGGQRTPPEEVGAMLPYATIVKFSEAVNPPLAAIQALSLTVRNGMKTEMPADAIVANATFLQLSTALDSLASTVGACERVRNTPTPFGYVVALRGFLLLWLFTMPFTLVGAYGFAAVPAMALVSFLFLNLETMAMQIEQPFGDGADDLPLEEYVLGIEQVCLDFFKRSPFRA